MQTPYSENQATRVVQALELILSDEKFVVAPQMSAFLKYIVMETLAGNTDRIKAYTVAVDALGKPSDFDPQQDPSVRVLAKRMRDRLSQYYERTVGHEVIIRLSAGSYVPVFDVINGLELVEDESELVEIRS